MAQLPPLDEAISFAVAQLFADDPVNRRDPDAKPRDPSHSVLNECFQRLDIAHADVKAGKEKRVRAVLSWAIDNDLDKGRRLVASLVSMSKGCGGFRPESPNYGVSLEMLRWRINSTGASLRVARSRQLRA